MVHFHFARSNDLVLHTRKPRNFEDFHKANSNHSGILVIYQDNDVARDMGVGEIVKAFANIEAAGVEIRQEFHILNAWRY